MRLFFLLTIVPYLCAFAQTCDVTTRAELFNELLDTMKDLNKELSIKERFTAQLKTITDCGEIANSELMDSYYELTKAHQLEFSRTMLLIAFMLEIKKCESDITISMLSKAFVQLVKRVNEQSEKLENVVNTMCPNS